MRNFTRFFTLCVKNRQKFRLLGEIFENRAIFAQFSRRKSRFCVPPVRQGDQPRVRWSSFSWRDPRRGSRQAILPSAHPGFETKNAVFRLEGQFLTSNVKNCPKKGNKQRPKRAGFGHKWPKPAILAFACCPFLAPKSRIPGPPRPVVATRTPGNI